MKKTIYLIAFSVFGVLVGFFLHAAVEITAINLLLINFGRFGLGLSWDGWFLAHTIFSIAMLVIGAGFGLTQGYYWWERVYSAE